MLTWFLLAAQAGAAQAQPPGLSLVASPQATSASPARWLKVNVGEVALDLPSQPTATTTDETLDGELVKHETLTVDRGDFSIQVKRTEFSDATLVSAAAAADASAAFVMKKARDDGPVNVLSTTRRVVDGIPGREIHLRVATKDPGVGPYSLRAAYFYRGPYVYELIATFLQGTAGETDAARVFASIRAATAPDPVAPPVLMQHETAPPSAQPPAYAPAPLYNVAAGPSHDHGPVHVRGYTRKDGTYVRPYNRRSPRR